MLSVFFVFFSFFSSTDDASVASQSQSQSIASYSKSRYSKSSTVRCSNDSGWLMFAGMEMRDKSLPMFLRSKSQMEKDWFSGCGAGKRSRFARPYASSSSSSSDSELDAFAVPEETEDASSASSSSRLSSSSSRSAFREMTKSCLFTTSAASATSRSRSSEDPRAIPADPWLAWLTPVAKLSTEPYSSETPLDASDAPLESSDERTKKSASPSSFVRAPDPDSPTPRSAAAKPLSPGVTMTRATEFDFEVEFASRSRPSSPSCVDASGGKL